MVELTSEQREKQAELWKKKIGCLEYRTLDLCGNILDGYQARLNEYGNNINQRNVPVSRPDSSIDSKSLHDSTITLQLLLGRKCLYRGCQYPQTLETALQEAGLDEQNVTEEVKRCNDYLEKARELRTKSLDLAEQGLKVTHEVLTAKLRKGEVLTVEEKEALDFFYDVVDANH